MTFRSVGFLFGSTLFAVFAGGCAAQCPAQPLATTATSPATSRRTSTSSNAIYRLDFALTSGEGGDPSSNTSFSLTLPENENGEAFLGKNVPLTVVSGAGASPRHDIGTKVRTRFEAKGDSLLLHLDIDATSSQPPAVQKFWTQTRALAPVGKSTVVAQMSNDTRQLTLAVTPTKLQ